jgi:hypothetical protein
MTFVLIVTLFFGGNVYYQPQIIKIEGYTSKTNCDVSGTMLTAYFEATFPRVKANFHCFSKS